MTGIAVIVFAILAALALGFVIGRIWQIRCVELERRASFTIPTVARIPLPRRAETTEQASASAARRHCTIDNRPDQSGTADLFMQPPRRGPAKSSTSVTSRPPEHLLIP